MNEDEKWSSAAFVATSKTLSLNQIQEIIGLPPSRFHNIGDPVSSRSSTPVHNRDYYSIQSKSLESESMEQHIEEILSLLEPRMDAIRRLSSEANLCLFCGFSSGNGQGGFGLSPELLSRLARLGLEVVLDLYPPDAIVAGHAGNAT